MTRFLTLLALVLAVVAMPALGNPQVDGQDDGPPPGALVLRVEGPLDAGHLALFQRAASEARATDAALVMAFDTPGGELTRMRQFAAAVDEEVRAGLTVIGWVDDEALSAGTWIAIACQSLYMRERATIGAAQAVTIGPQGLKPAGEKIASAYRAWVRAWAEDHGRSPLLAQAMIDPETEVRKVRIDGVERLISGREWDDYVVRGDEPELVGTLVAEGELWALTGTQAVQYGFADALAETVDEVLAKQGLSGTRFETLEKTASEDLLASLHGMRLLLLFLGLFFGYVELKAPGFGIPGVLSLLCFSVMFVGQYLVGLADIPHIVLAVLGIGLVATELFVLPGMIWPGAAGALCLIAGLLLSQVGPGLSLGDAWDRLILFDATFQLVGTATAAVVAIWILSRFLPETPVVGRLVLAGGQATVADAMPEAREPSHTAHARPGAVGETRTTLRPVGKVVLEGDRSGIEHEARAETGVIESGARVVVVEVSAGRLLVREQPGGSAEAPEQHTA
ncbi:MAG: hypothetical protein AAGB93_06810 [Planctomycetota bacterium]